MITDFPSRFELIEDFCVTDANRRTRQIVSSKTFAEKLHDELNQALRKIEKSFYCDGEDLSTANNDDDDDQQFSSSSTPKNHHGDSNDSTLAEKTLVFNSPENEQIDGRNKNDIRKSSFGQTAPSKISTTTTSAALKKRQQLEEQRKALQHEIDTLRKQQHVKKLAIHYKCAEISRLRSLAEDVLPRAKQFSSGVNRAVAQCQVELNKSLVAAQEREEELRTRLLNITSSSNNNSNNNQNNNTNLEKENQQLQKGRTTQKPGVQLSSSTFTSVISLLEKSHAKLEQEKQRKLDLIATFEKRIKDRQSVKNVDKEIKLEMKSMKAQLKDLRHQERSLRHTLAADAVRRVLDARHKPLQLRGRNAVARLEEAMAFLKAEVVHFGHDIRPVSKALSAKDPESMFKQAHNELKLIVGLMLPSGENVHAQFHRKQGQTWPLTAEALEDRFPVHKIDTAYVKLQEMVVAWDCLSKRSQEQLTTAHDVVNNAEVLLMFARHVGDLYAEKRSQLSERANKVATLSTGDSGSHHHHHHHNTQQNQNSHSENEANHTSNLKRGSSVGSAVSNTSTSQHQRTNSGPTYSFSSAAPCTVTSPTTSTSLQQQQQQQQQHKSGIPTTPSSRSNSITNNQSNGKMMTSPTTSMMNVNSGTRRR